MKLTALEMRIAAALSGAAALRPTGRPASADADARRYLHVLHTLLQQSEVGAALGLRAALPLAYFAPLLTGAGWRPLPALSPAAQRRVLSCLAARLPLGAPRELLSLLKLSFSLAFVTPWPQAAQRSGALAHSASEMHAAVPPVRLRRRRASVRPGVRPAPRRATAPLPGHSRELPPLRRPSELPASKLWEGR